MPRETRVSESDSAEYVERIDLGIVWSAGAPMPIMLAGEGRTFLLVYLRYDDPVTGEERVGTIEFHGCHIKTFGHPGEDTLHGHRLFGKGLRYFDAFVVRNSAWLQERKQIDSVHPTSHQPAAWDALNHYVLTFKDTTFECLARWVSTRTYVAPMNDVLRQLVAEFYNY
jgi:hypothetical protein